MKATRPLLVALLTGCAQMPTNGGRYFQITNPSSGAVGLQLALTSPAECARTVQQAFRLFPSPTVRDIAICASASASAKLPYRATLRDKRADYLYDLEANSLQLCGNAAQSSVSAGADLVSGCRAK